MTVNSAAACRAVPSTEDRVAIIHDAQAHSHIARPYQPVRERSYWLGMCEESYGPSPTLFKADCSLCETDGVSSGSTWGSPHSGIDLMGPFHAPEGPSFRLQGSLLLELAPNHSLDAQQVMVSG